jgi:hypothetical protein
MAHWIWLGEPRVEDGKMQATVRNENENKEDNDRR